MVWINEKAKEIKSFVIGDVTLKMYYHYEKYNIVSKTAIKQDPMNSDYMSSSPRSVTVLNEWIEEETDANSKFDSLVEFYNNQFSKNKTKRVVIGETYIELWSNNINYNITIGNTKVHSEQHTVFSTSSETDAFKKFIALSNSFLDILG